MNVDLTLACIVMFLSKHESFTASISTLVNLKLFCRLWNDIERLAFGAGGIVNNGTSAETAFIERSLQ